MPGEIGGAENPCEGDVADAQASRVGAERRHYGALAVAGKATALGDAGTGGDAGLGVQMAGDLAERAGRLMAKGDRADADFAGDDAAEVGWQSRIVVTRDPDPVPARLHRRDGVAIRTGEARMRIAIVKAVAERNYHARIVARDHDG